MKTLIIYYSRTGNTKKIASEIAISLSADIEEIIEPKKRSGIIGWLKSGYDATLRKITPINSIKNNLSDYDLVIIGTPVWSFNMASPIRSFLTKHYKQFKRVAFFTTMGGSGDKRTFLEMQNLCRQTPICTAAFLEKKIKKGNYKNELTKFVTSLIK